MTVKLNNIRNHISYKILSSRNANVSQCFSNCTKMYGFVNTYVCKMNQGFLLRERTNELYLLLSDTIRVDRWRRALKIFNLHNCYIIERIFRTWCYNYQMCYIIYISSVTSCQFYYLLILLRFVKQAQRCNFHFIISIII